MRRTIINSPASSSNLHNPNHNNNNNNNTVHHAPTSSVYYQSHRSRGQLYYFFVGAMTWVIGYNLVYPQLQRDYYEGKGFITHPPHRPPLLSPASTSTSTMNTQSLPVDRKVNDDVNRVASSSSSTTIKFSYQQPPTHHACDDPYEGILHIAMGDIGGAAGTIFFQFVVGQILYAERNRLKPWVHFNNVSYIIFDERVHHGSSARNNNDVTLQARVGRTATVVQRPQGHWRDAIPGPLTDMNITPDDSSSKPTTLRFTGSTGVWEHYFEPVSDFVPGDASCQNKWYVTLDLPLITPGIHGFAPWSPSGWRYQYLPDYITQPHIPLTEWLEPQRRIGARVTQQYLKPKPYLIQHAERVNPDCSNMAAWEEGGTGGTGSGSSSSGGRVICLGMHIRHSDKAAGRRLLSTSEFLPFARAFVHAATSVVANATQIAIYLATDSWNVLQEVQTTWPQDIVKKIRLLDGNSNNNDSKATKGVASVAIIRSKDDTAVFDLAVNASSSSTSSSSSSSSSGGDGGGGRPVGHHVTNEQVLVEILALSRCQFLLHGLSAVSEAAIWMHRPHDIEPDDNIGLHTRSVNLEDPDHLTEAEFATLVQMVLRREPPSRWPFTSARTDPWWHRMWQHDENQEEPTKREAEEYHPPKEVIVDYPDDDKEVRNNKQNLDMDEPKQIDDGAISSSICSVLHVATVGKDSSAGAAFFTHILNQLLYAEQHELVPWIHLDATAAPNLFDVSVHSNQNNTSSIKSNSHRHTTTGTTLSVRRVVVSNIGMTSDQDPQQQSTSSYPGPPNWSAADNAVQDYTVHGNGIWESYFEPVTFSSPFVHSSQNCKKSDAQENGYDKPPPPLSLITLDESQVSPGLDSLTPWSVKAWRYDNVPDHLWVNNSNKQAHAASSLSRRSALHMWYEPMRRKGHEIVQKYFRFRPYLLRRVEQVNPVVKDMEEPCLAIHFRNSDKHGRHRKKVSPDKFLPYMQAFAEAGGKVIYVATDSHQVLQYMNKNFPDSVRQMIRSQGEFVVRATKERNPNAKGYPTHFIAGEDNHHRVNAETLVDILAMSKCQLLLHTHSTVAEAAIYLNLDLHSNSVNLEDPDKIGPERFRIMVSRRLQQFYEETNGTSSSAHLRDNSVPLPETPDNTVKEARLDNATIVRRLVPARDKCRTNAVVYLAQKQHSSYGHDSFKNLLRSLDLLHTNYLSKPSHMDNADIFIFHTGDFNESDLVTIESHLGSAASRGAVNLVDLSNSPYWARPEANANDDPNSWYAYPLFSEGYRRMMHWYAIDIWNFFQNWNVQSGCSYRYILRLDEDSYIHSPIPYDIFDLFETEQYVYGFRLCAYEMKVSQRMWNRWKRQHPSFAPQRELDLEMCGFYNNLFVADLKFFTSPKVSRFLKFMDQQGHIYRRRLGDLMIHTMSVIAFARPQRIHRFLDFTYEHSTLDKDNGCLTWGGIQAGYNDPNASLTINHFYQSMLIDRGCTGNATFLQEPDLSPTYSHIPLDWQGRVSLHTVVQGWVETSAGKGILSG